MWGDVRCDATPLAADQGSRHFHNTEITDSEEIAEHLSLSNDRYKSTIFFIRWISFQSTGVEAFSGFCEARNRLLGTWCPALPMSAQQTFCFTSLWRYSSSSQTLRKLYSGKGFPASVITICDSMMKQECLYGMTVEQEFGASFLASGSLHQLLQNMSAEISSLPDYLVVLIGRSLYLHPLWSKRWINRLLKVLLTGAPKLRLIPCVQNVSLIPTQNEQ